MARYCQVVPANAGRRIHSTGLDSSADTSSGVSDKIDRNVRDPRSRRIHDEGLAVAFGVNRQQGRDRLALDSRFDDAIGVLARDLAALTILAFKPVARKLGPVLIDIGIPIHLVGIAGGTLVRSRYVDSLPYQRDYRRRWLHCIKESDHFVASLISDTG